MVEITAKNPYEAMLLARSHAINEYAMVEQQLCRLFSKLTETEPGVAALIFFKITNARVRLDIMNTLFKRKVPKEFRPFWNSLQTFTFELSKERNLIVHWVQKADWGVQPTQTPKTMPDDSILATANLYWQNENSPTKSVEDVLAFADRCKFASLMLGMFLFSMDDLRDERLAEWREICSKAIVYPPTDPEVQFEPSVWRRS